MVKLMSKLNVSAVLFSFYFFFFMNDNLWEIYKDDISKIAQNGGIIRCPGLFLGEMLVQLDSSNKFITFAMIARNPDIEVLTAVFKDLTTHSFSQCICYNVHFLFKLCLIEYADHEIEPKVLCPSCIADHFCHSSLPFNQIGVIETNARVLFITF